jgi:hypothetical protein
MAIDDIAGVADSGKAEALRAAFRAATDQFAGATPEGESEAEPVALVSAMCTELEDWLHGQAATVGVSGWDQMEQRKAAEAAAAAQAADRAAELDEEAQAEA